MIRADVCFKSHIAMSIELCHGKKVRKVRKELFEKFKKNLELQNIQKPAMHVECCT